MSRVRVVSALRIGKEDLPAVENLSSRLIDRVKATDKLFPHEQIDWRFNYDLFVMEGWIGELHFCDLILPLEALMSAVKESRNWRKMIMNTGYNKEREEQIINALKGHRLRGWN